MTKKTKMNIARWTVFVLVLLLVSLVQNTPGLFPTIFGARALLLLPVIVCMGMFERETVSAFLGLFAGLLWDTVSLQHPGFNSIYLMLVGGFCGLMVSHLMQNSMLTALILSFGSTLLYVVLYWLFFLVIPGNSGVWQALLTFYLPTALYTFLLTPFLYLLLRFVRKHMRVAA